MHRKLLKDNAGKLVLVTTSLLLWLFIIVLFKTYGYEKTWQLWKVPTEMPPFVDFRLIPGSAESFLRGYEPTVENPYDPRGRIFNYPTFWRFFFYSGVTQEDTIWISTLMIALFFLATFLFPQHLTIAQAVAMLLVMFSPAAMLLYERGNVDLIVFVLCVAIVLAEGYSAYLAALLLMAGTVVKLFPFFGVSLLLRESKARFIRLAVACLGVLLLYAFLTWESISAAWNLTLRGKEISYGANVFFYRYEQDLLRVLSPWFRDVQAERILKVGPILLACLLIAIAGGLGLKNSRALVLSSERNLAAFRMGASVYAGTFLLGNNWDYRLAFLSLVVPQLLEWTRALPREYRYAAWASLFALLASCWHFIVWYSPSVNSFSNSKEVWFVIDEVLNWTLVFGLAYLLFASSPDWLRKPVQSLFTARRLPQRDASPQVV